MLHGFFIVVGIQLFKTKNPSQLPIAMGHSLREIKPALSRRVIQF